MGYVDADGQPTDDAPTYGEALVLLNTTERKLKGAYLEIARLQADREAAALADPTRPQVELLHALWKRACNRRRDLDAHDREQMGAAVRRKGGFRKAVYAIAGAAYDSYPARNRNGRVDRKNDLELIFRNNAKTTDFANRAPRNWTPDPARIAEIGGVPEEFVRHLLKGTK